MPEDKAEELILGLKAQIEGLQQKVDHLTSLGYNHYNEALFYLRRAELSHSTYVGDFRALTTLRNGYRMYVDTRSRDLGVHLMYGGDWESHYTAAFSKMLRPGSVVLDVGANLGWYSMNAAPIIGHSGTVYAIEPNKRLAELVQATFEINGFDDFCHIFNAAAGDKPGVLDFSVQDDRPGHAYVRDAGALGPLGGSANNRSYLVPTIVLDDAVLSRGRHADVIKMDIEGFEGVALKGLVKHLAESRDLRMIIEWGDSMNHSPMPKQATASLLHDNGLIPYLVDDQGNLMLSDWETLVAKPDLTNIVLLREGDVLAA